MEAPVRVLLVEDNDVYRDALEFLLRRRDEVDVVGSVADGSSAASACAERRADVVVIDYRLPDVEGSVVASEIREHCPAAAIVFLSASAGADEREAAKIAGAPLVRKDEGVDALVKAISAVAGRMRP